MMTRRQAAGALAAGAAMGAADGRPNILFFFPDQHRYDWTTLNRELPLRMPHFDALCKRGIAFTRAAVASPLCAPSRACLAAGKEYEACGVESNAADYPLEQTTYYSLLREAGYQVMGCGKLDLHKKTQDWGLDGKRLVREWGFSDAIDNAGKHDAINSGRKAPRDPYMAYLESRGLRTTHIEDFEVRGKKGNYAYTEPTPLPDEAYCDNWVAANGLKLLRSAPAGRPWHLVVNFTGPHVPMDITRRMDGECRGRDFPQPHAPQQFDARTHNAIRQNYSAMVENIDRWLGVYVEELRKRGELERTVIVYSSDHGEMLGDHGLWGKSLPHEASVRVPLAVVGPGVRALGRSDALVYVHDLAATFLDMAGVRERPAGMTSQSLVPLLAGRKRKHRTFLRSGLKEWRVVTDGRYKLVRGYKGAGSRLFDLADDTWEERDIAASRAEVVKRLEKEIAAERS